MEDDLKGFDPAIKEVILSVRKIRESLQMFSKVADGVNERPDRLKEIERAGIPIKKRE